MAVVSAFVRVDFSNLLSLANSIARFPDSFEAALPAIINEAGHKLYREVVQALADLYRVPPAAIRDVMDQRNATVVALTYSIVLDPREFGYVRWVTADDERVCPICRPLHLRLLSLDQAYAMHPAHPNCRCQLENVGLAESMMNVAQAPLLEATEEVAQGAMNMFVDKWSKL